MAGTPRVALIAAALLIGGCAATGPGPRDETGPEPTALGTSAPVDRDPVLWQISDGVPESNEFGPVASADGAGYGVLADVRLAGRGDVDRIVFEFVDAVPGYIVSFDELPVTSDGADMPIRLQGRFALLVSLVGASAYAEFGDTEPVYQGPRRISAGDTVQVAELVELGDFESTVNWAAGIDRPTAFEIKVLAGPPRLVIDVNRS